MLNNDNRDIFTLVILMAGTLWGAIVKYLAHLSKSKEDFSFLVLLSEFFTHGFSGFLVFFIARGIGLNEYLTIAFSLFAAFMGLKILNKIEDEIIEGLDGLSDWIKRLFR